MLSIGISGGEAEDVDVRNQKLADFRNVPLPVGEKKPTGENTEGDAMDGDTATEQINVDLGEVRG